MTRPDHLPAVVMSTSVHLFSSTRFTPRTYPADRRATVRLGSRDVDVTLYADRADLARLRDLLAEVVAQLDAASGPTAA
ncbi:MAG: hypothetical protein ABS81_17395 [Pseudonocardia sp. SCN 72-86]|nr:MAG: hypothetical protein ABS81_17395 [Pseudonocardia sp. SCN 72-86]